MSVKGVAIVSISQRGAHVRARGMSLLEMLLVIALIAAVGLLTAGMFSRGVGGMQLRSAGKDIANQLRQTRAEAIARGAPQRLAIAPREHRWESTTGRHGTLPDALRIEFEGAAQLQRRSDEGTIEFHPDGGSSGGRIVLQQGSTRWRIDVGWLTGEVTSRPDPVP